MTKKKDNRSASTDALKTASELEREINAETSELQEAKRKLNELVREKRKRLRELKAPRDAALEREEDCRLRAIGERVVLLLGRTPGLEELDSLLGVASIVPDPTVINGAPAAFGSGEHTDGEAGCASSEAAGSQKETGPDDASAAWEADGALPSAATPVAMLSDASRAEELALGEAAIQAALDLGQGMKNHG